MSGVSCGNPLGAPASKAEVSFEVEVTAPLTTVSAVQKARMRWKSLDILRMLTTSIVRIFYDKRYRVPERYLHILLASSTSQDGKPQAGALRNIGQFSTTRPNQTESETSGLKQPTEICQWCIAKRSRSALETEKISQSLTSERSVRS